MTQNEKVLRFMQDHGCITPIEAMQEFSCMRLASRINDLKNQGHTIRVEMENRKNRYGEAVKFARYYLIDRDF